MILLLIPHPILFHNNFYKNITPQKNNIMKRNKIRLTESHLKKIISETVN